VASWGQVADLDQGKDGTTVLQLFNNPVDDVLAAYERLTGKEVIKDAGVTDSKQISIMVSEPVTRQRAIELIESALQLNGYVMVPGPGSSVKVINLQSGRNPRSEGLPMYSRPEDIPEGARIISYFMSFRFLSAEQALPIFTQQASLTPPYGAIVAVPNAQALIITETSSVVRSLIDLQRLVDVPPPDVEARFIALKRADAERVVKIINQMISARASADRPGSVVSGSTNVSGEAVAAVNVIGSGARSGLVELVADVRTNRVMVVASPLYFEYFRKLVEAFDQASDAPQPFQTRLRYVAVADILPALAAALKEGAPKDGTGAAFADGTPQVPSTGVSGPASTTAPLPGTSSFGPTTAIGGSGSGGAGVPNVIGTLQAPENSVPITVSIGKSRIIADQRTNNLIVLGPPDVTERVRDLVRQLDQPARQIYLATVIAEVDVTDGLSYGTDLVSTFNQINSGGIAGNSFQRVLPRNVGGNLLRVDPSTLTTVPRFLNAPGFNVYGQIGSIMDVFLSFLQSTNRVKILSRPSVYTSNNKKALISVGQQIPVPSTTVSTVSPQIADSTALTSTIEYKDVVLQLEVIPLINSNGEVTLNIAQSNNELGVPVTIAGSTVNQINTQQLSTTITVPNFHTLVIGGLIQDRIERTRNSTPLLGDIPLLGIFFSGEAVTKRRTEILIMIQPQIVTREEDVFVVDGGEKARSVVAPEVLEFAAPQPVPYAYEGQPVLPLVPRATFVAEPAQDQGEVFPMSLRSKPISLKGGVPAQPPPPPPMVERKPLLLVPRISEPGPRDAAVSPAATSTNLMVQPQPVVDLDAVPR
jgi:type II secretion system protein D